MRVMVLAGVLIAILVSRFAHAGSGLTDVIADAQSKAVKIYGSGGFRGLEAYQSGFLISSDGYLLTAWSYVLDTDEIGVVLGDGRRFLAKLVGADPRLELAVLKIDSAELPHFGLATAAPAGAGTRVLAFSNLFGVAAGEEPVSVQHGVIAVETELSARRGVFKTPYRGPVYVLDAMTNNPGAAGGALTNYAGELVGVLGKELRNADNNTWLNYALPISAVADTVEKIRAGTFVATPEEGPPAKRPAAALSLDLLGLVLVPNVVERTPPFVDSVRSGSAAARAGLRPDDLIVFVNDVLVQSSQALKSELALVDRADEVRLTVLRDSELIKMVLQAEAEER